MPTLGSVSGTYGYGRSPQSLPPPGFTYRSIAGTTAPSWNLSTGGPFVLNGNIADITQGNVYVITPTSTFTCNVKVWGGGGGSANVFIPSYMSTPSGQYRGAGGGAVEATVTFQMGQPYTIFAGGAGLTSPFQDAGQTKINTGGGGGAASGIWRGNIFQIINSGASLTTSQIVANIVIGAGGGAGASSFGLGSPGAGGAQVGDNIRSSTATYTTQSNSGIVANSTWFYGRVYTNNDTGGGSGGTIDANLVYPAMSMTGGNSFVASNAVEILSSRSVPGTYGIPGLYDNSYKSLYGENNQPGRVVLYLDEYRATSITATGGDVTTVPIPGYELQYRYHTFTANGKFAINTTVSTDTIDVFVVAGGGGGADAGGGGGGVVLRTGLQITSGNYLVHVGQGGTAQDRLSSDTGGYWGGYPGDHSAFYNNQLNQYFPDNYCRLIYSFNTAVYFISPTGNDDINDGGLKTPFASITGALSRTENISQPVVYAVLPGTYNPPDLVPIPSKYTQIDDGGYPRIWVCSPGKVSITFINSGTTTEPSVILRNPASAVYGAIFKKTSLQISDTYANSIFADGSEGLVQNCVFTDTGPWGLFSGTVRNLRIVNCVFYTSGDSSRTNWPSGTDTADRVQPCLIQNSAFSRDYTPGLTYLPTIDNTTANLKVAVNATTYKITNVVDRGVYAGPYGWGGVVTRPETTARAVTFVAPGGGGGANAVSGGTRVNLNGGSSGGATKINSRPGVVYQFPWLSNVAYASYGYPGGLSGADTSTGAGGGGAGFPARPVNETSQIGEGGLGIEWPYGAQIYYGSGGNGKMRDTNFTNYTLPVEHGAGRGGDAGNPGTNGAVVVRYVVPGPYTPPEQFVRTENLVATGGRIRIANGYKEHTFYTSGVFSICNLPDNVYVDILAVGGGVGGSASQSGSVNSGGGGGQLSYQRLNLNSNSIYNYPVTVGAGGGGGTTTTNGPSYSGGLTGSPSSVTLPSYKTVLTQISAAGGNFYGNAQPGSLITSGLFSDNTTYYGGTGASGGGPTYAGGIGGGGQGNGGNGVSNTGGGGGGGVFGNYYYQPRYYTSYGYVGGYYVNGNSRGGDGGTGIVIIRYPYTP